MLLLKCFTSSELFSDRTGENITSCRGIYADLRQWNHSMKYFFDNELSELNKLNDSRSGIRIRLNGMQQKKETIIVSFLYIASPPALSLERELITNWMRDEGLFANNLLTRQLVNSSTCEALNSSTY